jgi:hypothetical protein
MKGEPCLKNLPMAMLSNSNNHLDAAAAILGARHGVLEIQGEGRPLSPVYTKTTQFLHYRRFSCEPRDPRSTRISSASLAPDVALHLLYPEPLLLRCNNPTPKTATFQTCIVSVHHSNDAFRPLLTSPLPAWHIFRDLKVYHPSPVLFQFLQLHLTFTEPALPHTLSLSLSPPKTNPIVT